MKAILLKEIKSFFGSPIGYLVIGLFIIINGLYCFVFDTEYNILNSGFSDMNPFFRLSPWILALLIPAITMRSFSDEQKLGTIEILFTKPLNLRTIFLGKFFGAFILVAICLLPSLLYVIIVSNYTLPHQSLDFGSTLGSYFGLLFLISAFTSIGIFTSTLTENQIVAYILGAFICFVFYIGFSSIASFFGSFSNTIDYIGMDYHYKSISRGVLDTRDIIYFLSVSIIFYFTTILKLKSIKA